MIKNYLQIAYQNIFKYKLHSLINVSGLAIAVASSLIMVLYASFELNYDKFHDNSEDIYVVYKERNTAQGVQELLDTWNPLSEVIQSRYPDIANGARLYQSSEESTINVNNTLFSQSVLYADPSILDVFTIPLLQGDAENVLTGRNSIILSEEATSRIFGSSDPIGETITIDNENDYIVTGILEGFPQNSTISADMIAPLESLYSIDEVAVNASNWERSYLNTYIQVNPGTSVSALENQFTDLVLDLFGTEGPNGTDNLKLRLLALDDLHDFYTNARSTAFILLGVALCIIVIACINFMNLTISRSLERSKEVGVRKTLGGLRGQLIIQFICESLLISTVAVILGVVLAEIFLPTFNGFFNQTLTLNSLLNPMVLVTGLTVWILITLLSGAYPAFFLSRYKIVESIRGRLKSTAHGIFLRNSLTLFQFSLAIMLIISMVTIWYQIQYMKNANLNFNQAGVIVLPIHSEDFSDMQAPAARIESLKDEIRSITGVINVSESFSVPGDYSNAFVFASPEGWTGDEPLRMMITRNDENYFDLYEMRFIEGENFSANLSSQNNSIIINETAMSDMGWTTAVGKRVNNNWTVVGVVEDFHIASLEDEIRPLIHVFFPAGVAFPEFISVKINAINESQILSTLEQKWDLLGTGRPFEYYFLEDRLDDLYSDVENISRVIGYFSFLSIVIANLGLMGLVSYVVIQRTKEMGIRKVFGATLANLIGLLTRAFVKPVIWANILAWPLAFLLVRWWLEGFAYRISISVVFFISAGLFTLLTALLTIFMQSLKTANTKPAVALKYE